MEEYQQVVILASATVTACLSYFGVHLKNRTDRKAKEAIVTTYAVDRSGRSHRFGDVEEASRFALYLEQKHEELELRLKREELEQKNIQLKREIEIEQERRWKDKSMPGWRTPEGILSSSYAAREDLKLLGGPAACSKEQLEAIAFKKAEEIRRGFPTEDSAKELIRSMYGQKVLDAISSEVPAQVRDEYTTEEKFAIVADAVASYGSKPTFRIDASQIEAQKITADRIHVHSSDCETETIRNMQGDSWKVCTGHSDPEDDIVVFDAGNGDVLEELRHIKAPPRRDPSWYATKMPPEKKPEPHQPKPLIEWAKEMTR